MICLRTVKKFCRDDISKIENYQEAINDETQTWHCHHRLELTLDGEFAHSKKDLERMDMYFKRPYFELIFLKHSEHTSLHSKGEKNPNFGKTLSEEHKQRLSESNKGRTSPMKGKPLSAEQKQKCSESHKGQVPWNKGKTFSEEHKQRLSESHKGQVPWNKGQKLSESHKGRKFSAESIKKRTETRARNRALKIAAVNVV